MARLAIRGGIDHPPARTVGPGWFGSWSAALRAADLATGRRAWSAQEILDGLRALEQDHGRAARDLRNTRDTPCPPATAVARTFGSFRVSRACARLGWHAAWTPVADANVGTAVRAYAAERGRPPTRAAWRRERPRPGASVIIRRYGSWSAALRAAESR